MARLATRQQDTGTAIRELLRIASQSGRTSTGSYQDAMGTFQGSERIPESERARYLLDAPSIQRLFAAVPPSTFVNQQLAAAYLDCSVLTLERRMRAAHATSASDWRHALADRKPPDYRPVGRYRWGFILAQPRPAPLGPPLPKPPTVPELRALHEALAKKMRFLCRDDGAVAGAFGQADLTVKEMIALIEKRATFQLLTPLEALARPWSRPTAREPWAEAVAAVMARIGVLVAHGQAQTAALALASELGPAAPATRRGFGR